MNPLLQPRALRRADLPVGTIELARYLIGKTLVHELPAARLSGAIVETEAYPPGDAAGHAFRGKTRGNQSLFLGPGYCYVYFTYGSSFMVNVTSEEPGVGAGVLLRALEPLEGIELMQRFRKMTRTRDIARGPGRLAQAMHIDKRYDGVDLCAGEALWLGTAARRIGPIRSSTRIGLTREVHRKRRFFESGNPYVSGPRSHSMMRKAARRERKGREQREGGGRRREGGGGGARRGGPARVISTEQSLSPHIGPKWASCAPLGQHLVVMGGRGRGHPRKRGSTPHAGRRSSRLYQNSRHGLKSGIWSMLSRHVRPVALAFITLLAAPATAQAADELGRRPPRTP